MDCDSSESRAGMLVNTLADYAIRTMHASVATGPIRHLGGQETEGTSCRVLETQLILRNR